MTKITLLCIAAFAASIAATAKGLADGAEEPAPGGETEPKKPRGRPAGSTTKVEEPTGPNDEERLAANKQLIAPLVAAPANQGEEVKKVISKYSATGLKGLPAEKQADFEKDIAALTY